ncbi:probable mediator of RNA polymerase II transcription subunit 26b [Aristolochia californica]|uniref:probable mediator of RNA polymerase II transcription subunit 26b n=1 Tax=Aristolochia californica TaxID=171875 RepID=UPI0035D60FD5
MEEKSGRLDYWRDYFLGANSDIFEVIEYAIIVAASDCPQEFRLRRDRIAERLFSPRLTKCSGCDRVELAVPEEVEDGDLKGGFGGQVGVTTAGSGGKESKVNSTTDDRGDLHQFSNYSYNAAEALTDEIEEKSLTVAEVFRIKDTLSNHEEESDSVLFESLRRLQLMELSVGTLKITEIGKAVNGVRKHRAKQIRQLARTVIDEWKATVDEWVIAATAITAGNYFNDGDSPDSVNPSVGLPSPPLDEGIFLSTQTSSIELSQFFEGMDDDGNFRNIENEDYCENGRKPEPENPILIKKDQNPVDYCAQKENCGRKPVAENPMLIKKDQNPVDYSAQKENCGRKPVAENPMLIKKDQNPVDYSAQKNCGRKLVAENPIFIKKDQNPVDYSAQKNCGRKLVAENPIFIKKDQNPVDYSVQKEHCSFLRKPGSTNKPTKNSTVVSGPSRPQKPASENKSNGDNAKLQQRAQDKIQKKPPNGSYNKSQIADEEAAVKVKLEATKRLLHEGYMQADRAKRQRTIQMVELHDLPKQGPERRKFHHKPGSHNRHFSYGRR